MVNRLLIFLLILPWFVHAETKITAEIDQSRVLSENVPLKGTILITHNPADKVDESSFKLKNAKFPVAHVQETPVGASEVISIYRFELPGKSKGLYVLDEISAKIGGQTYSSVSSSYEVGGGRAPPPSQPPVPAPSAAPAVPQASRSVPTQPASLKIEQQVEAPDPFYPGKRGRLIYRYIFSGDIELSKESLPLMKAEGFLKIGEEEVKDYVQGGFSVREINQTIQATKPGIFSFEGAAVEGRAYSVDSSGRRSYDPVALHSETPSLKIEVKPLPTQDKPPSFTGAVGKYTFQVKLNSPKEMNVGDKISLGINIGGPADTIANVQLPELCCLPGMSGLFKLSDLPPSSVVKDNVKQFTVEMRPLSSNAKEIPGLEFSYFDPDAQQFKTVKSEPIPITVHEIPTTESPTAPSSSSEAAPKPVSPKAIEIGSNYQLTESDLENRLFGGYSVYWLIPFGIALILLERNLRQASLNRQKTVRPVTSEEVFNEAMKAKADSPLYYQKINQAFLLRLFERGEIPSTEMTSDQLAEAGAPGEVRRYLQSLEEERFSGRGQAIDNKQAKVLFERLRGPNT